MGVDNILVVVHGLQIDALGEDDGHVNLRIGAWIADFLGGCSASLETWDGLNHGLMTSLLDEREKKEFSCVNIVFELYLTPLRGFIVKRERCDLARPLFDSSFALFR